MLDLLVNFESRTEHEHSQMVSKFRILTMQSTTNAKDHACSVNFQATLRFQMILACYPIEFYVFCLRRLPYPKKKSGAAGILAILTNLSLPGRFRNADHLVDGVGFQAFESEFRADAGQLDSSKGRHRVQLAV